MIISFFLAKFWGSFILIFALLIIFRPKMKELMFQLVEDDATLINFAFITLILGLINITIHNVWTWDFRLVITLFGWFALLKGVIRFAAPEFSRTTIKKIDGPIYYFLVIMMIGLGGWLFWIGTFCSI